jgi:hypothetical protein
VFFFISMKISYRYKMASSLSLFIAVCLNKIWIEKI